MERPNINNYPIVKDGKHQYYHDDLHKYIDHLERELLKEREKSSHIGFALCGICDEPRVKIKGQICEICIELKTKINNR